VFARPVALMAVSITLLAACRTWLWAGRNWTELLGIGFVYAICYVAAALALVVEGGHREVVFGRVAGAWKRLRVSPT
jgi:hypothetical protein